MKVRNMLHILAIYGATIGFTTAHAFECDNNPNVTCETSSYFTSYQFRHPALESSLGERTAEGIKVGPLDPAFRTSSKKYLNKFFSETFL